MLWPAGNRNALGVNPYRYTGNLATFRDTRPAGDRYNIMYGEAISRTSSVPEGYAAGGAYILPIIAGGMSSAQAQIILQGAGNALSGGPMDGSGAFSMLGDGGLSMIVSMEADGTITVTGAGGLALTIAMSGNGAIAVSGLGGLSLIIPLDASGSFAMTAAGNLKGNLEMEGSWSPYTELSPQSLATAVWSALAAQNNEPGTMGDLLNAAGGGGISGAVIDQIADAVWEKLDATGVQYGVKLTSAEKWAKIAAALSA